MSETIDLTTPDPATVSKYLEDTDPGEVAPTEISDLDRIKADLAAPVESDEETEYLPVPLRPAYKIGFVADVSGPQIDAWTKAASRGKKVDQAKLVQLCIANKVTSIWRDGEMMVDGDGDPITFKHRSFLDLLEAATAAEGVKKFFVRDGHVDSAAKSIMVASGWGEDWTPDPTAAG